MSTFSEESKFAATVIKQALQKSEEASAELPSEPLYAKAKGCTDSQKVSASVLSASCKDVLVGEVCSHNYPLCECMFMYERVCVHKS